MVVHSVFARIERGQGADLGKGHFCARSVTLRALLRVIYILRALLRVIYILRALLHVILHFEGTMEKITYLLT